LFIHSDPEGNIPSLEIHFLLDHTAHVQDGTLKRFRQLVCRMKDCGFQGHPQATIIRNRPRLIHRFRIQCGFQSMIDTTQHIRFLLQQALGLLRRTGPPRGERLLHGAVMQGMVAPA
jgi:hypothetical protein